MPAAAAFPPPTHASPTGSNSRLASAAGSPVYLDLAYLPGGGAGHLDQDFFLRVRALCYVISGQGQRQEEGLRAVLDALLAGKQRWDLDLQVGGPQGPGTPVHRAEMLCPPQDSSGDRWCPAAEKCHQRGGCFPDLWGRDLEAEAVLTPHAEQTARPPCVCTVGFGDVGTQAPWPSAEEAAAQGVCGAIAWRQRCSVTVAVGTHRCVGRGRPARAVWQCPVTRKVLGCWRGDRPSEGRHLSACSAPGHTDPHLRLRGDAQVV